MTEIEEKNVTCFLPHNTVPVSVGCRRCQNVQGCHHIMDKASSRLRHSCAIVKQNSLQPTKSLHFNLFGSHATSVIFLLPCKIFV